MSENCKTQPGSVQQSPPSSDVLELNVGGQVYYTRHGTLTAFPNSLLGKLFSNKKGSSNDLSRDFRGRYFIDRDGFLFRYVLDYLRDKQVVLPDHFPERGRLKREADYFQLPDLAKLLSSEESKVFPDDHSDLDDASAQGSEHRYYSPDRRYGYITVSLKGPTGGKEGDSDPCRARKLPRIFISSRIGLAKEVFGDALNENRDADRPLDRYTCRFHLKFKHLERAFDMLSESGFHIVACNSSLTSSSAGNYTDDRLWSNYAQYIFYRGPSRWSSSHCDCCCKSHKSEREGESGTSFNELSTSCSETQSEASSPQGTVIRGPVSRRPNIQSLDRPAHKGPAHTLQQAEMRRKTDMLRVRTFGVREREAAKRKANKEKMTPEQELQKCIQDFHRIRIPDRFPERKYMWQSELLRKYRL
ncbi:BTB/POZ domain-containing protein KCTD16-like [Nerophis lumbriciformis]|uniref:BTB/POZ domain-containing protein KCTD16-like n=1 Tax=Nerophis lumbriciformis TaxID=546530 RepID=UPI002ADF5181|nr:BTB/POZ domain-containing protein KCTD16-like [Nerophis lumbriciformis]XP_061784019.1 BTB/POZ domain-containing protein KCTD16-like [Nerophis lumbriciformis]XP_061784020.1 BTB/POZ domain-containing protein KCTD16-like [Nerophis lumbriciformis]XP_061784021.1 BTB/POZ domain-containing protein KCTD16-like [Nerophis lumbriciformis]XP_061784022.1 BTB/POZ domain-containing protein KCTD16-like [Nerophis lumbriciformis]